MISKSVPGFCFVDPTNKNTINIRVTSVNVVTENRRIRAIWNPELAQDLTALHNIDAEAELTTLLGENLRNEIDRQIIQDLHDNQRFYQERNLNEALNRWNRLIQPIAGDVNIHRGNNDFDNIAFPMVRRVAAQTIGLDLVAVQPLEVPNPFINYNQYFTHDDYQVLPNEEGWYTSGVFESLLIKIDMLPFRFIPKRRSRRQIADIRPLVGL
jgi:hypothetical protein